MSIQWTEVEHTLGKTTSDVLVIFDCCHAGLLCRPAFRGRRRSFYYVAACKGDQRTRSSGEKSFTAAMIWALERLVHSSGFTVTTLISTLMEHDKFPRDQQEAVVYPSRFGHGAQEIWIAPSKNKQTQVRPSLTHESPPESRIEDVKPTANILDLRFHFSEHALPAHIEATARALKHLLASGQHLHFHRITFIDHTSFVEWPAKHWLKRYRSGTSARNSATSTDPIPTLGNSQATTTRSEGLRLEIPATQSSTSAPCSAASTTVVASPSSGYQLWEDKEGMDEESTLTSEQSPTFAEIARRLVFGFALFLGALGGGQVELV